jgi:hypothetical protein
LGGDWGERARRPFNRNRDPFYRRRENANTSPAQAQRRNKAGKRGGGQRGVEARRTGAMRKRKAASYFLGAGAGARRADARAEGHLRTVPAPSGGVRHFGQGGVAGHAPFTSLG